jgi:hypothetical protein
MDKISQSSGLSICAGPDFHNIAYRIHAAVHFLLGCFSVSICLCKKIGPQKCCKDFWDTQEGEGISTYVARVAEPCILR